MSAIISFRKKRVNIWRRIGVGSIAALLCLSSLNEAFATNYLSPSFVVQDPVVEAGGGSASNANYQQLYVVGQPATGISTSASFGLRSGFLYFPVFTTAPTVTATAGVEQVALTWTAAVGNVPINHYDVGTATVSGAEVYESVGNVLTFTKTGLTAGTTYFFTVRAIDATGSVTITSSEVTAVPTSASTPPVEISASGGASENWPAAPYAISGEALDQNTIRWFFQDRANNETGFLIRDADGNVVAQTPPWVLADVNHLDEFGLSSNQLVVGRRVYASSRGGVSKPSEEFPPVYTLIESPTSLEGSAITSSSVMLRAFSDNEGKRFSNLGAGFSGLWFENVTTNESSGWVKAESYFFANLQPDSLYTFKVKARNGDGVETPFSPPITFKMPKEAPPPPPTPGEEPLPTPSITILSPTDGQIFDIGDISFIGVTEALSTVTLHLNGVISATTAGLDGKFRFDFKNLPAGEYTVFAEATTVDGRQTSLVAVHFSVVISAPPVSPPPPTVEPVVPILPPGVFPIPPTVSELPILKLLSLPSPQGITETISEAWKLARRGSQEAGQNIAETIETINKAPAALVQNSQKIISKIKLPSLPSPAPLIKNIALNINKQFNNLRESVSAGQKLITKQANIIGNIRVRINDSIGRQFVLTKNASLNMGRLLVRNPRQFIAELHARVAKRLAELAHPPAPTPLELVGRLQRRLALEIRYSARLITITGNVMIRETRELGSQFAKEVRTTIAAFKPPSLPDTAPFIARLSRNGRSVLATIQGFVVASTKFVSTDIPESASIMANNIQDNITKYRPPSPRPVFVSIKNSFLESVAETDFAVNRAAIAIQKAYKGGISQTQTALNAAGQSIANMRIATINLGKNLVQNTLTLMDNTSDFIITTAKVTGNVLSPKTVTTNVNTRLSEAGQGWQKSVSIVSEGATNLIARLTLPSFAPTPTPDNPTPLIEKSRPQPTKIPQNIPTDTLVPKSLFGDFTLGSEEGDLRLLSNSSFRAFVKPSKPVSTIKGELVLEQVEGRPAPEGIPKDFLLQIPGAQAAEVISEASAMAVSLMAINYEPSERAGIYEAIVPVPPLIGTYRFITEINYKDGPANKKIETKITTERSGYIYSETERGQQERIKGAFVTLRVYREETKEYVIWPGALFDQINPIYTDETGEYQFLVPVGRYRIGVDQPNYERFQSEDIEVQFAQPIARPIEIKPVSKSWQLFNIFK